MKRGFAARLAITGIAAAAVLGMGVSAAAVHAQSADTTPPAVPVGISASVTQSHQIYVSWSSSTDNVNVEGYYLYRNGGFIASIPGWTFYTDTPRAGIYFYTVAAYDTAGNVSAQSAPSSQVTVLADTMPPTAPTNFTATPASTSIALSWNPATDDVAVVGYYLFKNGTQIMFSAPLTGTSYTDTGLKPGVTYSYSLIAYDSAGNTSGRVNVSAATIFDVTPPSAPTGLSATKITPQEVDLAWNPSTDNVGIGGYLVYRNGTQIATVDSSSLSYADTSVSQDTSYSYSVMAYDTVSNTSAMGAQVNVVTLTQDYTPPSIPKNFYATALSASQISLTWSPSTDNAGVAGYRISRDGVQIADIASTTYRDTDLATSTTYQYFVVAYDTSGNVSAYQSVAATTLAANPPPAAASVPAAAPTQTPATTALPAPAASATSYAFTTLLSYGMTGSAVVALQKALIAEGDLAPQYATGFFGSLTQSALQKFQCAHGIVCSGAPATTGYGLAGPRTRAVLNAL